MHQNNQICSIFTCFRDKNDSERRRWAFLIAYNRANNNPVYEHNFPRKNPPCSISTCFSDRNDSDRRHWAFLIAYNRADNDPVYEHNFPGYTPMSKVGLKYSVL